MAVQEERKEDFGGLRGSANGWRAIDEGAEPKIPVSNPGIVSEIRFN